MTSKSHKCNMVGFIDEYKLTKRDITDLFGVVLEAKKE